MKVEEVIPIVARGGIIVILSRSPLKGLDSAESRDEVCGREGKEGEEVAEEGRYRAEGGERKTGGGDEEGEKVVYGCEGELCWWLA